MAEKKNATVLVIGDDPDIAGSVALSLRQRGLRVEHTHLVLAVSPRWAPSGGRPQVLVVNLDVPNLASPARLRQLLERPWALGVPLVLATADPPEPSSVLDQRTAFHVPQPSEVGAIVTAVDQILGGAPTG
jgi:hypothetical protein